MTAGPDAQFVAETGLAGARVLVTGGVGGIGRQVCDDLLDVGAEVVCVDRRSDDLSASFAQRQDGLRPRLLLDTDLRDPRQVSDAFSKIQRELGGLDGAALCAGGAGGADRAPLTETTWTRWRSLVDGNLDTAFLSAQGAARLMVPHGGSIVLVSSQAASVPAPGLGPYCTAKAGIRQMARVMATELAAQGIRVNTVAPGYVATPANREVLDAHPEIVRSIPRGRIGLPRDVSRVILHLLSPAADFVTGAELLVDGGFTAARGGG